MAEQDRRNVIVMTVGLAGSSVVTGLIAQAGYWSGENSFKKTDYDTFENSQLISLNRRLFKEAGYEGDYAKAFDAKAIDSIAALPDRVDPRPYREFVDLCNGHAPWIWKDPRLWVTIRAWGRWMNLSQERFIIVTREPLQSWTSSIIRRHIQSYGYLNRYTRDIEESVEKYLREIGAEWLRIVYEDLLTRPEDTLQDINRYLGTGLSMDHLRTVFKGRLYKRQRSLVDLLHAVLIYTKNYRERLR